MESEVRQQVVEWLQWEMTPVKTLKAKTWLIGSLAAAKDNPRDCDILIILPLNQVEKALQEISSVQAKFNATFNLSLHTTVITEQEETECQHFLEAVFSKPYIPL